MHMDDLRKGTETRSGVAMFVAVHLLFYPNFLVQDWTTAVARRRAEKRQWHALVRERCRADGPTTRLYDLELAEGLHPEAAAAASSTGG